MDLSQRELLEAGLDAVEAEAADLPVGMDARVIEAIVTPAGDTAPWPSQAAFMRTAAELGSMLDELAPEEWDMATAVAGSTVRGLVMHLVGVERYMLGQLGFGSLLEAPNRDDHYPVSSAAAADLAEADSAELAGAWWRETMRSIAACAEVGPDHPVAFHHLSGTVRGLLVVRTFELWTHDDDIRRATNRPLNRLDDDRLALMSSELMSLLAHGMALAGTTRPGRTARIELIGPGAGTFDVALAPDELPGLPDVTVRTEALQLCRLTANRVSMHDLAVEVTGDSSLLEPILVGATAFAFD